MNKTFKVMWNAIRRQFVVVNEVQKARKKSKSLLIKHVSLALLVLGGVTQIYAATIYYGPTKSDYRIVNKEAARDFSSSSLLSAGNLSGSSYQYAMTTSGTDIASWYYAPNLTLKADYYVVNTDDSAKTYLGIGNSEDSSVAQTIFIGTFSEKSQILNYGTNTQKSGFLHIESQELVSININTFSLGGGIYTHDEGTTEIKKSASVSITVNSDNDGFGTDTEFEGTLSIKVNDDIAVSVTTSGQGYGIHSLDNGSTTLESKSLSVDVSSRSYGYGVRTGVNSSTSITSDQVKISTLTQGTAFGIYAIEGANTLKADSETGLISVSTWDSETQVKSQEAYGVYAYKSAASNTLTGHEITIDAEATSDASGVYSSDGTQTFTSHYFTVTTVSESGNAYGFYALNSNQKNAINSNSVIIKSNQTDTRSTKESYGVRASNSRVQIGLLQDGTLSLGEIVTITSTGGLSNYGVDSSYANSQVDIAAAKVKIASTNPTVQNTSAMSTGIFAYSSGALNIDGTDIAVASEGISSQSVYAELEGSIRIGDSSTERVTVESKGTSAYGLKAYGDSSTILVTANNISVTAINTAENGGADIFGIHAESYSESENFSGTPAEITLISNADDGLIQINSDGIGISAYSNGVVNIDGNLNVSAINAVDARGASKIKVNTDPTKNKTTVLNGDIRFSTPSIQAGLSNNSGSVINANVDIHLYGSASSWTGSSYSVQDGDSIGNRTSNTSKVKDFKLTLSNGAQWNATNSSFVNDLTIQGTGNKITPVYSDDVKEIALDIEKLTFEEDSALTTRLNLAYTSVETDEQNVVTGASPAFKTIDVKGSASLIIEDKFTYALSGLKAMQNDYKHVDLVLQKAQMSVSQEELSNQAKLVVEADNILSIAAGSVPAALPADVSGRLNILTTTNEDGSLNKSHETEYVKVNENGTLGIQAEMKAAELDVGSNAKVFVGSADQTGKLTVSNLKLSGTLFLDPSWESGQEASQAFITFDGNETTGQVVVGRNSEMEIGADSDETLKKALSALGRKLDSSDLLAVARVNKALTLKGGSLVVDGQLETLPDSIAQGVLVAEGSALILNGEEGTGGNAVITSDGGAFTIEGELFVDNAKTDTTYTLASGFTEGVTADAEKIKAVSNLITLTKEESDAGTLVVSSKANEDLIKESIAPNTVNAVVSGADGSGADRILALYSAASGLSEKEATKALNTIALMGTASGAQAVAINSVNMINDTLNRHGSVLAAYAHDKTGADLWIDLNGSFSKASRYHAGSAKYGFKSDLAGATIGADYAVGNGLALGGAFSFGTGSARGQGSGAGTKNDIEYYGFNVYGAWNTPYVNLIANIGYTLGKNEISQQGYKGKPDVNTFSVGVRAEKAHRITDSFTVTPHIGIRYMNVDMDSFTAGGFKYSAKKVNFAEIPVGVSVSGETTASCGASIKPFADFTLAPALGTKKARNSFGIAGSSATDTFSARVANSNLYQGKVGLEASKGNHSLGFSYGIGAGSDGRVDQNLQAKYRYSF